jgi:hypothetical protein
VKEKVNLGYGLVSEHHLDIVIGDVCDTLGNGGGNNADIAMKEICAQETLLGECEDRNVYKQGAGVTQFDRIGFVDVRKRVREKDRQKIIERYGIDVKRVQMRELDFNPLLAIIFTRLKYLKIAAAIPNTLEGRAEYWKAWHNSEAGAGEPEEYVSNANRLIYNRAA